MPVSYPVFMTLGSLGATGESRIIEEAQRSLSSKMQ